MPTDRYIFHARGVGLLNFTRKVKYERKLEGQGISTGLLFERRVNKENFDRLNFILHPHAMNRLNFPPNKIPDSSLFFPIFYLSHRI